MAAWVDELTLISQQPPEERVNAGGFENEPQESARTVFCNKKSVGYSEYFKSQQTGKVVEAKCEVHKADYEGEDTVEMDGRRFFVLKTYDIDDDTIELTLTDLRHKDEGAYEWQNLRTVGNKNGGFPAVKIIHYLIFGISM